MYEDRSNRQALKTIKSNMTLDFAGPKTKKQFMAPQMLSSPDLGLLKLASPELERLIIQQNGMVTTTPTPTQFLFPKNVSEEQEAYARGFVDALAELHTRPSKSEAVSATASSQSTVSYATLTTVTTPNVSAISQSQSSYATTTSLPDSVLTVSSQEQSYVPTTSSNMLHIQNLPVDTGRLGQLKEEEPQTVPCLGSTPPLSPIDMESQEKKKLERKRARNRVAARKCRTRKLERIARLEDRVSDLKSQNSDLSQTASSLREQVYKLKQQIMEHVNSGCHVMLSPNLM